MITWWHIALLLMTLSRVASFAISRRKNSCCKDADKEDLISQLPDDILASIIARIPTKFAVSTSTLSKRWRNLYKSVSNICLRCEDLLQYYAHAPHSSNSGEILFKLERFFQLYSSGSKIHCVNVQCCITKSYADRLEQCIYSLGKLGIETLYLGLSCCSSPSDLSFSCHLLSKMPSLKSLFLFACPLQPILNSHCNSSLQTIELRVVTILPGSLECILSNCLRLHSLYIGRCLSPSKLCFCGPNLQLETLIIESCQGAETIEIYASNLLTLEFRNHKIVNFIFHHVPQLRTFYFAPRSQNVMSHVFGRLAKDLPLLESLTFETKGDFYQESARLMRMGIETFSNLRRLDLLVYCTPKTNLLELSPFLLSCPLLQEFHLAASNLGYDGPKQSKAVVLHSELKKVQIIGFDGTENEIEFLLYIIRSAVSLEKMVISRCGKYYKGYGRWQRLRTSRGSEEAYEAIQKQLQDQALSKTAQVIVQYTS